jgi:hypothetical protein
MLGLAQRLGTSPKISGYEENKGAPFGKLRAGPSFSPGFCCATPCWRLSCVTEPSVIYLEQ